MNLESLVTKDYLTVQLAEFRTEIHAEFSRLEAKVDSNHRIFIWTQAIIMTAVILPYLERLMAL